MDETTGGRIVRRLEATPDGLAAATGAAAPAVQERLVLQALDALCMPLEASEEEQARQLEAAYALLQELQPRDAAEGMLAAQMVAVHGAAMDYLRRAAQPGCGQAAREAAMRDAARLLMLFPRQLAHYDRRRGIGQQTMTVEHVVLPEAQREALAGTSPYPRERRSHGVLTHDPEPLLVHSHFDLGGKKPQPAAVPAEG